MRYAIGLASFLVQAAMTSLDSLPPGVVERINEFVCEVKTEIHGEIHGNGNDFFIRRIWWTCYENSLMKLFVVSRRFCASLTPPPRPPYVDNDQRQWIWMLPGTPPIIEEVD